MNQGWNTVHKDPGRAQQVFETVLLQAPNNLEAHYGVGYALLSQNRPQEAQGHLCTAIAGSDIEIQRDVRALLNTHQLSCP